MIEEKLNLNDFELDEIESIELVGEIDTIDITVDDTHMFYANDIYTHNSSVNSELTGLEDMGGSIKRGQVAHLVISGSKSLEQKETGTANLAILKSRFGKSGITFKNCKFDNGTMEIDTKECSVLSAMQLDSTNKQNRVNTTLSSVMNKINQGKTI